MRNLTTKLLPALITAALLQSGAAFAGGDRAYEVTVTNLTRGQVFTPILAATHKRGVELFSLGSEASSELAALAEGGDTQPLTDQLLADRRVSDIGNSGVLLFPGDSVTVTLTADRGAKQISLASMMIPTNDGFIALNGAALPREHRSVTYWSPGYDAGTEPNDELCNNIPGPACGGTGGSPGAGGEDYVHIHAGIHGIGDLQASEFDWRNPVAKITITNIED